MILKKDNAVYLHTIKELAEYTGHSWHMDGLQVLLSKPAHKPAFEHPFRSDSYWVFLVMDDQLTIILNGEEHVIKENTLMILPPHTVRQPGEMNANCKIACVAFTPEFLLDSGLSRKHIDLFEYLFNSPRPLQVTADEASRFMNLITMLKEKNFNNGYHPFATEVVRHFFNVFQFELASLYHKYSSQNAAVHDRKEDLLWRFLALLPKHIRMERSLQFYANRLYVTPKYLTQTIKKLSGKTAGKFIDDQVIVEAKNLLRDHSLTIAQVADLLYFSDQFFFSKFFKRYTGITPSDFRRNN